MSIAEEHLLTDLDNPQHLLALRVLEDFSVTQLLRVGRTMRPSEISSNAEGFTLSRAAIREGLHHAARVVPQGSEWQLQTRAEWAARPREERARRPLESVVEELLIRIGKPLREAVVAREIALMRGVRAETIRDSVINVLKSSRAVRQTPSGAYLHKSFILDAGAPTEEHIVAENKLEDDNDWVDFVWEEFPKESDDLETRLNAILNYTGRPLAQKTLGFLLWRQEPETFDAHALAEILGDKTKYQFFVGGAVASQSQMPAFRAALSAYAQEIGEASGEVVDAAAILRRRIAPDEIVAPAANAMDKIRANAQNGEPVAVAQTLTDILEMEPDDARFAGALHGLNDALRNSDEYMPAGIGRWVLRASVPEEAGKIPENLRPVTLALRDADNEPVDIEMSDDGLEGDCAAFVHSPDWEELSEEVEVRYARSAEASDENTHIVLYPHFQSGTIKLRRRDEEFFAVEGALTRIAIKAHSVDEEGAPQTSDFAAWASRDAGLIYGLGDWNRAHLPASGGVLHWTRRGNEYDLRAGNPDKKTHIDAARLAELEALQERSAYVSLYDLLQTILGEHTQGVELPTIWAEVNVVRRTSKRLMCSVLSAYHAFYFKQRGANQLLWRFDAARIDQGFKRNKRKFVRK